MNASIAKFLTKHNDRTCGLSILEIGAANVNGRVRDQLTGDWDSYTATDIQDDSDIDVVVEAEKIIDTFGVESFDVVICCEVLEHIKNWREAVRNIKGVCRVGGMVLLTTRSPGFPIHGHPFDYWRFTVNDIADIFADYEINDLRIDTEAPGVFVLAKKVPSSCIDLEVINPMAIDEKEKPTKHTLIEPGLKIGETYKRFGAALMCQYCAKPLTVEILTKTVRENVNVVS